MHINQKIDDQTASGLVADTGLLLKGSAKLDLGFSVLNVGSGIKFINEADPLPTTIKAGVCNKPTEHIKIGIDASKSNDADANFGAGAEYCIKAGEKLMFPIRAGYRTGYETEQLSGLAAGAGVMYNSVMGFDFAWVPMGILGDSMKFGLSLKF
ncbi:MAG: hypothetical protein LHV68_02665 [Elusimicrobia bacterium]|nr:hypothetical protein [Candidatus Liberimonas magnetica]